MKKNSDFLILIVDDVSKNIQLLATILSDRGYKIRAANSGAQALKMVSAQVPDLILLDVMMPEMDGYEVCKILKESDETKHVPIIFLTAKVEPENIVKGFKIGGADYVTKPFIPEVLLSRIDTQLENKASRDHIQEISEERREMLHILCHDLANPFYSIVSLVEMLKIIEEEEEENIPELIERSANHGLSVINLVREMRALDEKKHELKLTSVNLREVIEECVLLLRNRFQEKKIDVELDIPQDIVVLVDLTSFVNSVVNNLLTNASKFSFENSKIVIEAKKAENIVTFIVRDFGIGMPKDLLHDIFDVSKTTSRDGTLGEPGTGFGMPLVKKFVNAYGGTINIESTEKTDDTKEGEHGTTIILTLKTG